jgi:hydrogenase-4 component B
MRRARRGLRFVITWDCGYVAPTARMQYSAQSFASIITGWFGFILRPEVHARLPVDVLPFPATLASHTPETVLQYVVDPLSRKVMSVATAARALQHGGVQSYLLYLVIGIGGLGLVVAFGGGR